MNSVDIYRQKFEVYEQSFMNDGIVWKLVRAFKDGHHNVHDKDRTGQRPSVITDNLLQQVDEQERE